MYFFKPLIKLLFFILLPAISSALVAKEVNFECQVKITHNIIPQAYHNTNKEVPRAFKYYPKRKILQNSINNLEYKCIENDLEISCSTKLNNSNHRILINRISLRLSSEVVDGELFINEIGKCIILELSEKKF